MSEKQFWREFLIKNNKFLTIAFGGNNPLFIPMMTIEKDYDEIYINNNRPANEAVVKSNNILSDVDFVQNLETAFSKN